MDDSNPIFNDEHLNTVVDEELDYYDETANSKSGYKE